MSNDIYTDESELRSAMDALKFPKVTKEFAEGLIEDIRYDILSDGTTTICSLIVFGGSFSVRGESSSMDARNFDEKVGRTHAYNAAFRELMQIAAAVTCHTNHLARMGSSDHVLEVIRRNLEDDIAAIHEVGISDSDRDVLQYLNTYSILLRSNQSTRGN